MSWKTSFKICLAIMLIAVFVIGVSVYVKRSVHADAKVIALDRDDLIEMNNISIDQANLNSQYQSEMAKIRNRYIALREKSHVPPDFINDTKGSTVVGFRPETAEEKEKRADSQ